MPLSGVLKQLLMPTIVLSSRPGPNAGIKQTHGAREGSGAAGHACGPTSTVASHVQPALSVPSPKSKRGNDAQSAASAPAPGRHVRPRASVAARACPRQCGTPRDVKGERRHLGRLPCRARTLTCMLAHQKLSEYLAAGCAAAQVAPRAL